MTCSVCHADRPSVCESCVNEMRGNYRELTEAMVANAALDRREEGYAECQRDVVAFIAGPRCIDDLMVDVVDRLEAGEHVGAAKAVKP